MQPTIKKQFLPLILLFLLIVAGFFTYKYSFVKKEKPKEEPKEKPIKETLNLEELITRTSAPTKTQEIKISKELIEKTSASVPKDKKITPLPEEIIQNLSAPSR